jgi:hypothetical protein
MDVSDHGLPGSADRAGLAPRPPSSGSGAPRFRRAGRAPAHARARPRGGGQGALLGISLLGLRVPRVLAWPLALVGTLFGALGVVRAARFRNDASGEDLTSP